MKAAIFISSVCLLCGCQSAKDARDTTLLVAGVGTMVALSPLVPVTEAYHKIAGPGRTLTVFEVYRLREGVYALSNENGWFTDRSEQKIRKAKGRAFYSAWVVDLRTSERDKKGRIILSEQNLDRWFFRDTDVTGFDEVPANPEIPSPEYFTNEPGAEFLTLHTRDGQIHILHLKQT